MDQCSSRVVVIAGPVPARSQPLADPGERLPNGRGPLIFLCPKRYFSQFFLRSRLILNIILIEIWLKHFKNDFY